MAEHIPSLRCVPVKRNLPPMEVVREPAKVLLYTTYVGDTGEILDSVEEAEKPLELFRLTWKYCIVNRERAYEAARTNYTFATALAEYLALNQGIPFSQTHHVVRGIVMRLLEQEPFDAQNITGELVAELSQKELGYRIDITDQEIQQILDPRFCMNYRVTAGSAGTEETWRLIAEGEKKLQEQKKWLAEAKGKVDSAYARLRC